MLCTFCYNFEACIEQRYLKFILIVESLFPKMFLETHTIICALYYDRYHLLIVDYNHVVTLLFFISSKSKQK